MFTGTDSMNSQVLLLSIDAQGNPFDRSLVSGPIPQVSVLLVRPMVCLVSTPPHLTASPA